MPSSQLLKHRHTHGYTRVFALILSMVACGDTDPTAPVIPVPASATELAGAWTFSDSAVIATPVEETVCRDRGVITFTAGVASTAVEVRQVGTCISPRGSENALFTMAGTGVVVTGDSIDFTVGGGSGSQRQSCRFLGRLTGGSSLGASGSVSCSLGRKGTWQMSWGLDEGAAMGKLSMIDISFGHTCALDVTGQAYCWGANSHGQLGTGDDLPRLVPTSVAGGLRFTQISVANEGAFTCGLTGDGKAYCWGSSWGGRLGDGSGAEAGKAVTTPQLVVGGHTFSQIAAGGGHSCALTTSGAAYCWGENSLGQLGIANETPSSRPVAVSGGLTFQQIDTYTGVTCGVATNGSAWCWGEGWSGALGNGQTSDSNVPVLVQGGHSFASVSVGLWMACGVTTTGDGYCWGSDWGVGNLGTGSYVETQTAPAPVAGGRQWQSIRAGGFIACGVAADGGGYCWGDGTLGALGAGVSMKGPTNLPIAIAGSHTFSHVVPDWHACSLTTAGVAYCWGEGNSGAVGDGDLRRRWEPVKVAGQL